MLKIRHTQVNDFTVKVTGFFTYRRVCKKWFHHELIHKNKEGMSDFPRLFFIVYITKYSI